MAAEWGAGEVERGDDDGIGVGSIMVLECDLEVAGLGAGGGGVRMMVRMGVSTGDDGLVCVLVWGGGTLCRRLVSLIAHILPLPMSQIPQRVNETPLPQQLELEKETSDTAFACGCAGCLCLCLCLGFGSFDDFGGSGGGFGFGHWIGRGDGDGGRTKRTGHLSAIAKGRCLGFDRLAGRVRLVSHPRESCKYYLYRKYRLNKSFDQ